MMATPVLLSLKEYMDAIVVEQVVEKPMYMAPLEQDARAIAIAMQYPLALHVTFQAVEGTELNATEVSEHVADAVRKEGQVSA